MNVLCSVRSALNRQIGLSRLLAHVELVLCRNRVEVTGTTTAYIANGTGKEPEGIRAASIPGVTKCEQRRLHGGAVILWYQLQL